jgi:hypothetical protein
LTTHAHTLGKRTYRHLHKCIQSYIEGMMEVAT